MKALADARTSWQILIEPAEGRKEFRIHLFRHLGNGTTQILTENGICGGSTEAFNRAYGWQQAVGPSFRVGADLLQAFVDGLGESHGITQSRFMEHLRKCSYTHRNHFLNISPAGLAANELKVRRLLWRWALAGPRCRRCRRRLPLRDRFFCQRRGRFARICTPCLTAQAGGRR